MKYKISNLFMCVACCTCYSLFSCTVNEPKVHPGVSSEKMYQMFRSPDNQARYFIRWWWNGNRLSEKEIIRELDVMKEAGIGGVEINPVAFPKEATDTLGLKQIPWLSDEWLSMVKVATREATKQGMICDMIVGSGWPFGGEFLNRDEQIKMVTIETMNLTGPQRITVSKKEIAAKVEPDLYSKNDNKLKEVLMMRLAPDVMDEFRQGINVDFKKDDDTVTIDVPDGNYVLYAVVKLTGYMSVIHGTVGAKGPVLDHFNKPAVEHYLNRISDAFKKNIGDLGSLFRALFTDSMELEGANWSDDFLSEFKKRRGYSIEPYLPYVLKKVGKMGNDVNEEYGSKFSGNVLEIIRRVRYDYDLTLTELFKERFLDVMTVWCKENNIQSRMQAYGRGYKPVEASMNVDIPECETWYNSAIGEKFPENTMLGRGYTMANKFVASGAHLSDKTLISCEENTNTQFVFNETLERMKISGDLSNLSGVTHSILHGFNYSPSDAPFPGWIRYGAYWNEKNTIWKYFKYLSDYKARLSSVFQHSVMQGDIAIIHPIADLWTQFGTQRDPFPSVSYPAYAHNLWEAINQNGGGCDYLTEKLVQEAVFKDGRINYGSRSYKALIMMEVETIQPQTAMALKRYIEAGGMVLFIGKVPSKAPGLKGLGELGQIVSSTIKDLIKRFPQKAVIVDVPDKPLIDWYKEIQERFSLMPYVSIDKPEKFVNQVYYKTNDLDIFFFSNYNLDNAYTINTQFNIDLKGKRAWRWFPETGERYLLASTGNRLEITLGPAESQLIVFDTLCNGKALDEGQPNLTKPFDLKSTWRVTFRHFNGNKTIEQVEELFDLSKNAKYENFAGELVYETQLKVGKSRYSYIDLGKINGISELYLNNKKIGIVWHGRHLYKIDEYLNNGDNKLKIVVTTTLGNYCKSLNNNPVAQRWMANQSIQPCGINGPVTLYETNQLHR